MRARASNVLFIYLLIFSYLVMPLKFGIMPYVGFWPLPLSEWVKNVVWYEKLGFDTVYQCDHFYKTTYDPIVMLASCAAVTKSIHFGSLVFDVDYRHPVMLAKAAATLHLLSGGRFEFGIGAGWQKRDYVNAGISFDPPGIRIERLEEATQIIKAMWTQDKTSFKGKHYQIEDIDKAGELPEGQHPKMLIGGGGRKILSVAGRQADIIGINMSVQKGDLSDAVKKQTLPRLKKQITWAKKAARKHGRNTAELVFHMHIPWIKITEDAESEYAKVSQKMNITLDEAYACPKILFGTNTEIIKKLLDLHKATGISYFSFGLDDKASMKSIANSVIKPLKLK